jgi:hypothetical protein
MSLATTDSIPNAEEREEKNEKKKRGRNVDPPRRKKRRPSLTVGGTGGRLYSS